jgi:uncharacterized BrkB/YihY/UPF0761 family membrane protein
MEELDLLKKAWQKDNHQFEQISETEIYSMLHRKSSSIVKWILVISVIEVLFWAAISLFFNIDEYLKKMHAEELSIYFNAVNYINYAVILFFIYTFYKNYLKITTTASTKQLMQDILKTRKTVQYYVWYNLGMALLSVICSIMMQFTYDPQMEWLKYKIQHDENHIILLKTLGFMLVFIIVFVFLFWLFYRLLYGILLRKLHSNYKELKKIDL